MPTRRQFVLGVGVTAIGAGFSQSVFGNKQGETPEITFGEIDNKEEWLVLHNEEDTDVDITDWYINWEDENDNQDQWDQFQDQYGATTIEAEDSIKVATGAEEVQDADVTFDNDAHRMNDDGTDVYAVYLPDQSTEVANSEDDQHEETETETETETATETETQTETATETEVETDVDTETETETPTSTATETESGGDDGDDDQCPTDDE